MSSNSTWANKDGLRVHFGTRTVEKNSGAQPSTGGARQEVHFTIRAEDLVDVDVAAQLEYGVTIPEGAVIESAKLVVTEAFVTGDAAVLDIGLYDATDGSEVDDDGIDAAVAAGALTLAAIIACDGADIGTVVASPGVKVAASVDTGTFSAGEATLVVEYVLPTN